MLCSASTYVRSCRAKARSTGLSSVMKYRRLLISDSPGIQTFLQHSSCRPKGHSTLIVVSLRVPPLPMNVGTLQGCSCQPEDHSTYIKDGLASMTYWAMKKVTVSGPSPRAFSSRLVGTGHRPHPAWFRPVTPQETPDVWFPSHREKCKISTAATYLGRQQTL